MEEKDKLDRFDCLDYDDETEGGCYQFKHWFKNIKTGELFYVKIKNPYFNVHDTTLNKMKRSKKLQYIGCADLFQ